MTLSYGFDIVDNPAMGIFWDAADILETDETEDETVPEGKFSIVLVSANTPSGHNDELSIDGPRRAVVCEQVYNEARVDVAINNEFGQMFVPIWQRSQNYHLLTAPWNSIRPNGRSNGNAEIVAKDHSRILDTMILPFRYTGGKRVNSIITLNEHIPSRSQYGVLGFHVPTARDATGEERRRMNKELIEIANTLVKAGLPTFPIGDRNGTAGLWPASWGREASPPDFIMWKGKGIERKNARVISRVAGKITDHRGFIRVRLTVPINTLRYSKLPLN